VVKGYEIWRMRAIQFLVAKNKNRDAMMDMMWTLKIFLKDRRMELDTEKSKILVF